MFKQNKKRICAALLALVLMLCLLSGCAVKGPAAQIEEIPSSEDEASALSVTPEPLSEGVVADKTEIVDVIIEEEAIALAESPAAVSSKVKVVTYGSLQKKNANAVIDYSNTAHGYVMVKYTAQTSQRLKAQIKGPTTKYTYNVTAGEWEVFPLSDGNGSYQITVYQNVTGTKYASVLSLTTNVTLQDEFEPFLYSNQYVDYEAAPKTVEMAEKLTKNIKDPLKKVEAVYNYVVKNVTYDKKLASTVKSGYLPELDKVLKTKKGICFDYAALMTGMLRSQDIPCKLVVGYAGKAYHAWISVWSEENGWIDGVIWFDGTSWQRMDPTFASSGKSSKSIMAYIGDGANYSAKYFY